MRLGSIGGDDLFRPPFFPIGDQHDAPESGLREVVESGLVKGVGQAQVRILSRQLGPEHPREELAAAQADFHVSGELLREPIVPAIAPYPAGVNDEIPRNAL